MNRLSRREYLALLLSSSAVAGKRQLGGSPVISVQDFEQYPAVLTPAGDFFVRNHFALPEIDPATWSLHIGGLVTQPKTLSLAELRAGKQRTVSSLLECAGNGVGVGAVGCAQWEGILLGELVRACGIAADARYVRLTGADGGREPDAPAVQYSRCLSLDDATRPGTLLALGMNGTPLEAEHGFPARVIVPGRYGMDSVKWLRSVEALAAPDDSFYMTQRFRRVRHGAAGQPVGKIRVKSVIVKPESSLALRGQSLEAGGYAWSGAEPVQKVEVRLDRGPWRPARLLSAPEPFTWVPWAISLRLDQAGVHSVESRATAGGGETQPEQRDSSRDDDYELNHVQNVRFFSRP